MKKLQYSYYLSTNETNAVSLFSQRVKALLKDNLLLIKLFGSKVRGDYSKDSDIDILLILKQKDYALRERIYDILLDIDLEFDPKISLKIFSMAEIKKNKELGSPFIFNVEQEGILL